MTNNKEKILRAPVAIMDMFKQANAIKVSSFFSDSLSVKVNTYLFTMHSTMTVAILSISMILVGMKQYFGEPIECLTHLSGSSALDKQQLQHYCWMEGAFTIYNPGKPKTSVPNKASQGIGSFRPEDGDSKMHHKYYQWVYYILCAQCVLFYIPKHMWRTREDNRLRTLIEKLKFHHILTLNNIEQYQIVQDTFDIIMTSGGYFWYLLFCEIVCFVHLVLQIWFLNLFLGGRFFFLGIQWLYYAHLADDVAHDPLIVSFPRVVKCEFHWYGPSGSVVNVDTICFMPLNIVNEKIFVTLWFWFILLGIVTVFHIFNRLVVILIPYYRYRQLRAWAPTANKRFLRKLTSRVGNWFVLMTIATNIRPYYFRDLMERILQDHWNDKTFKPDCKVFFRDYCNEEGKVAVPIDSKLDDYSPERKTVGEKQKKKKDKKSKDKTSPPDAGWNVNTNDNSNSNPGDNWNNSDNNDWTTQNNENNAGWDGNWGNS